MVGAFVKKNLPRVITCSSAMARMRPAASRTIKHTLMAARVRTIDCGNPCLQLSLMVKPAGAALLPSNCCITLLLLLMVL
jgi:hypothetical protein